MPYQPTHPHPYLETISIVDGADVRFSVIINPKDIITGYQLYIYSTREDDLYLPAYTKKVYLDSPLYGSQNGTVLVADISPSILYYTNKTSETTFITLENKTITSIIPNDRELYWQIILYSNDKEIASPYYHFKTKTESTIIFNNITDNSIDISSCEHTFTATYNEGANDFIYYQYDLYKIENGKKKVIDSTGELIDSSLSYTYDGFMPGEYRLSFQIKSEDGRLYDCSININVNYDVQGIGLYPKIITDLKQNRINIDYSNVISVTGTVEETSNVEYQTIGDTGLSCATLPYQESIYYNNVNDFEPLSIEDDFTIYYSVHFEDFFKGTVISLTNEKTGEKYTVRYDSKNFYYKIGKNPEIQINPYVNDSGVWYKESSIQPNGTTVNGYIEEHQDAYYNTLFTLEATDIITDDSVFLYNDIAANFWWTIVLFPTHVEVYRGKIYSESAVS